MSIERRGIGDGHASPDGHRENQVQSLVHHLGDVTRLDLDLVGVELGQVEDVVDQTKEMLARCTICST